MKKSLFLLGVVALLAGCGNSDLTQKTSFDNYNMMVQSDYIGMDVTQLQNNSADKPIILSYSKPKKSSDMFTDNLLVSRSVVAEGTSLAAFTNDARTQLSSSLPEYLSLMTSDITFMCHDVQVDGILDVMQTSRSIGSNKYTYYIAQYYFVRGKTAYTISLGSADKSTAKDLSDTVKTINCDTTASATTSNGQAVQVSGMNATVKNGTLQINQ